MSATRTAFEPRDSFVWCGFRIWGLLSAVKTRKIGKITIAKVQYAQLISSLNMTVLAMMIGARKAPRPKKK